MFTIDVRFTIDEAISLMRAVAAKQLTEHDAGKRDDLELIRLKLYDRIYHHRRQGPIRMDLAA